MYYNTQFRMTVNNELETKIKVLLFKMKQFAAFVYREQSRTRPISGSKPSATTSRF